MNRTSRPSRRWLILAFLMAFCFISHLNRVSMAIAADERIMPHYGITPQRMGVVYSAFLLIYTLAMIPGGFFIDRVGAWRALAAMGLGTALFAAGTGGLGLAVLTGGQLWLGLVGVRAVMGLLTTPLHPGCARAVADWFPSMQRTTANGLVTGAALLGIASTYSLFGWLMDRLDWPGAFMVCGGATALLAGGWTWLARNERKGAASAELAAIGGLPHPADVESAPTGTGHWARLLTERSLILLTLSYAAVSYFQYLFFYWVHHYFESVLHLGQSQSRIYAGLPTFAMAFCMPLGGWLCDRWQGRWGADSAARRIAMTGMVLSALVLGAGLLAREPLVIVGCFTIALGALGLSEGPFWLTAVELGGRRGGAAAAVMNTGGNGIGLLAPLLTPFISEHLGWRWGISLGGLVCVIGALCWLGISRNPRRQLASIS